MTFTEYDESYKRCDISMQPPYYWCVTMAPRTLLVRSLYKFTSAKAQTISRWTHMS